MNSLSFGEGWTEEKTGKFNKHHPKYHLNTLKPTEPFQTSK
jgi:hypothetical protein